ncbi:hypothetical protein H257_10278 [Aphanomyces astaci]|uniref:Uncharacterized protein n=1 Tax=Aphanomyces astaci TaxID=112090 RepID=W4G815_APHAT|nr:hypothetical protein H257_10278 [Aphanomyces astaci]ETV75436.1 hypothetical protein H257_10278 [Aphanomyces astaci]|eukprot:XP_009835070.1 hypothetical protein H257_10278 [Aphanomyces astaci]
MPPLKVHLADEPRPIRCKARQYSLPQREFMQQHVKALEAAGFVYRNPASWWASAPLIVRKPQAKDEFRMTMDLRPINSQTEQIAWSMPMLEVDHLSGAFALDPSYQEMSVLLEDVSWSVVHDDDCLAKTNAVLGNLVELFHPDPQQRLFVFADASEGHWGSVITQVPPDQLDRAIDTQNTSPFASIAEAQVVTPEDVLSGMTKNQNAVHQATFDSLESFCQWTGMKGDVECFVRRCLHCASASGGAPRPLALHSTTPPN